MDKNFFQFGEVNQPDRNLREKSAFSKPIQSLPSGGKLSFALAQGFIIFSQGTDSNHTPQQFSISATYQFGEKKFAEVSHIDLRPYIGSEGDYNPVVEELGKLRQVAEKWK